MSMSSYDFEIDENQYDNSTKASYIPKLAADDVTENAAENPYGTHYYKSRFSHSR